MHLLLQFYSLRVLHISITWWSLTWVWITGCLQKSQRLFWVFKPILTILWSKWSQFFLWFSITQVFFQTFWDRYNCTNWNCYYFHSYFIAFLVLWLISSIFLYFCFPFFIWWHVFLEPILDLVFWLELGDPLVP